ncbi:hypothetical protein AB447_204005 [Bacillus glycinifermentans]|uniref:Uncharacterized protein n=1 Tax=Bacillus glycinifermentans TaxID=1664069 RepID=A0A0T6BN72_9BACI|nr:hypothetical protein AB447_204005 [Bacillus glycinifermentans]
MFFYAQLQILIPEIIFFALPVLETFRIEKRQYNFSFTWEQVCFDRKKQKDNITHRSDIVFLML